MPAGWEWRAGTVPQPTLGTLSAQRPRLGRRAPHSTAPSTLEAPEPRSGAGGWAFVLRTRYTLPSFPPGGILWAVNSSPGNSRPGVLFSFGERSGRGTQNAPPPDRRGLKEVRRAGPARAQVPRPSPTSSLT